jgi:multiple sugar transport system ATP-binding protein
MVFQNYALYPHMTLRDNLGFGLKMRGAGRARVAERVQEVAASLGLAELLDRKPAQLSGGQRQRVALGRAIARNARVFLLDEPLSNLDVQLRVSTRQELARLHRSLHVPMLYVTHDQEEAMTLGDRVAVMHSGRVLQVGAPMEIYSRPATRFVGGFVGSPRMNFFPGELRRGEATGVEVVLLGGDLRLQMGRDRGAGGARAPRSGHENVEPGASRQEVIVGIRPEDIEVRAAAAADLVARIDLVEPLGRELLLHVVAGADSGPGVELRVLREAGAELQSGSMLGLAFRRNRIHLFDAATEKRLADPTAEETLAGRP